LIKKTRRTVISPEFDRVILQTKEDSILTIHTQYKQKANKIVVKVFDVFYFADGSLPPIFSSFSEVGNGIVEESIAFPLKKNLEYTMYVYYEGEMQHD
jgi:hypothetical protein